MLDRQPSEADALLADALPALTDLAARRRAVRGVWRGQVESLSQEEFDACNEEIAREFGMLG